MLGQELSENAAVAMVRELADYDAEAIAVALSRCARELTGRLTLAAILERMPGQHLGGNEAWALCPRNESETVVWTEQIEAAYGVAAPLLAEGDPIAARMAFLESYRRAVGESRGAPRWVASIGHDVSARRAALENARALGRLDAGTVARLLPPSTVTPLRALPCGDEPPPDFAALRALVSGYRSHAKEAK
jgi:hypothetical protein